MFTQLKTRWQLKNNWQLAKILTVFALTGTGTAQAVRWTISWCPHLTQTDKPWLAYWVSYVLLMSLLYQILLLTLGGLFGEWRFFWAFEKKMWRLCKRR